MAIRGVVLAQVTTGGGVWGVRQPLLVPPSALAWGCSVLHAPALPQPPLCRQGVGAWPGQESGVHSGPVGSNEGLGKVTWLDGTDF